VPPALFDYFFVLLSLAAADSALYVLFAIGYIRDKKKRLSNLESPERAFKILETVLKKKFPELPAGFTWTEAIAKVKTLGVPMSDDEMDMLLENYEAYRYGGTYTPELDTRKVLKLAKSVRK
jgi:hypothetical protein